jgi:hypothetical protein
MIRAIATERSGNEEACPVSDSFLAKLYRASPDEARDLGLSLAESVRASLALFCSARVHLRELARIIAATCSASSLMREGRESGRVLWEEAMRRRSDPPGLRNLRKGVTLAGFNASAVKPQFFDIDIVETEAAAADMSEPSVSEASF